MKQFELHFLGLATIAINVRLCDRGCLKEEAHKSFMPEVGRLGVLLGKLGSREEKREEVWVS